MNTPSYIETFIENGIYQAESKWYTNIFCPHTGQMVKELEGKITARDQYEETYNFGVNDSSLFAMKLVRKGQKYGLFVINGITSGFTGWHVCHDPEVYVYDEIQAFGDWKNWSDWGYALCRQADKWKVIKVAEDLNPEYDIIASDLNSRDDALAAIGITDLTEFNTSDGRTWERNYFRGEYDEIVGEDSVYGNVPEEFYSMLRDLKAENCPEEYFNVFWNREIADIYDSVEGTDDKIKEYIARRLDEIMNPHQDNPQIWSFVPDPAILDKIINGE